MGGAQARDLPRHVKELIDLLGKPEKGELNYDGKERMISRLDAVRKLKSLEREGVLSPPETRRGVNLHIHTNESFSVFSSPSEAAWRGYTTGLEILGINDHYTIEGHREFAEACRILGLKATFNIEAMAMSEEARERGERYNDPKNPGRTYLCGKGVVHDLPSGSPSEKLLETVRLAFRKRCEEMTRKVNDLLGEIDPSLNLSFEGVLRLTPRGNVTERHIAQAVTELVDRKFPESGDKTDFLRRLIGDFDPSEILGEDRFQDLVRNTLLKTGGPAYVEEPPEAFPGIKEIVQLFRDYGSIPTYPVLGNPVTEKESDLNSLFDEIKGYGILAAEVIPKRNTRERLQEILRVAEKHGFPVFNGTEHNTKAPDPLLDSFSSDPTFLPIFRRAAYLILGHQFLSKYAEGGYADQEIEFTEKDRRAWMPFFSFVGTLTWPEEALEWLSSIQKRNALKVLLGLYLFLADKELRELRVKPEFKISDNLLRRIQLEDHRLLFAEEAAKNEFAEIANRLVTAA